MKLDKIREPSELRRTAFVGAAALTVVVTLAVAAADLWLGTLASLLILLLDEP